MTKFLRKLSRELQEGDTYSQATKDEVIVQKVVKKNGKLVVVEVRKSIKGKSREERQKVIESAKVELNKG